MTKAKTISKIMALLITAVMLASLTTPTYLYAQTDNSTRDTETTSERKDEVKKRIDILKQEAKVRSDEARQGEDAKTVDARKRLCEARKTQLTTVKTKITAAADRHLAKLDSVYSRVEAFVAENNLEVDDYDRIIADVNSSQEAATIAVETLSTLSADINCDDPEIASVIGAFREAVTFTKDSLKVYRSSLSNLIQSVKAAASETSTNDTTN